ncbi:MAG: tetratricopeptide repeat protein [Candidatus Thorarchaeota archaeon]
MSPSPEELLHEAVQNHQSSHFDKCIKAAEKARKKFQKEGRVDQAIEALRIMADCTVNARNLKKAEKLYKNLLDEGAEMSNLWYQSAANWGLGEVALHKMDYSTAATFFQSGLEIARGISDKWYSAWNAFGLANALRGMARLDEAKPLLNEAIEGFGAIDQATYVTWVERVQNAIRGEVVSAEVKVWLCPMCGSRFNAVQANQLKSGKLVTCEYCKTTVG